MQGCSERESDPRGDSPNFLDVCHLARVLEGYDLSARLVGAKHQSSTRTEPIDEHFDERIGQCRYRCYVPSAICQ